MPLAAYYGEASELSLRVVKWLRSYLEDQAIPFTPASLHDQQQKNVAGIVAGLRYGLVCGTFDHAAFVFEARGATQDAEMVTASSRLGTVDRFFLVLEAPFNANKAQTSVYTLRAVLDPTKLRELVGKHSSHVNTSPDTDRHRGKQLILNLPIVHLREAELVEEGKRLGIMKPL